MRDRYRKISYFAVLLALSFVMPYLIHLTIPAGGKTFLPMHIPVQLAGFLIGPFAGFLLGIVAPPFNFIISGMPPFPLFIAMMLELGAMGFFAGLFHRRLKFNIFLSLTFAI
ncbi:ECF transporter S component, partial [bacterium]